MITRPLLLLDLDGPLNPYRAKEIPPGYDRHVITEGEKTWSLLLNQQHGVELNALADIFQLVWATSWEHGANRLVAPRLGLPSDLPVILWPKGAREGVVVSAPAGTAYADRAPEADRMPEAARVLEADRVPDRDRAQEADRVRDGATGLVDGGVVQGVTSWKTPHVAEWVGARPFVWVDDEVNRYDEAYLRSREGAGEHLLQRVDANQGLAQVDFELIRAWGEARKPFA